MQKFKMFYDCLTFTGRGPAQVTRNESDVEPEPSQQLCHWIGHVLPTPHAVKTAHLLVTERQQQRDGIKQWPSFMDKIDHMIRKKHSWRWTFQKKKGVCWLQIPVAECICLPSPNCADYLTIKNEIGTIENRIFVQTWSWWWRNIRRMLRQWNANLNGIILSRLMFVLYNYDFLITFVIAIKQCQFSFACFRRFFF